MHSNVYDVFYSNSHQDVSADILAIIRMMLLLQEHTCECTNLVKCVNITH